MKQLNWYQIFGKSNIPDGRTVEPTDDIQIWLHCANIWNKAYTTLAEVLVDTDTLSALINSENAVDYMVRSTSWAVPVSIPTMTSNTTPSGMCSATSTYSGRQPYYAFDKSTSNSWLSADNAGANCRLVYGFSEAVKICKASFYTTGATVYESAYKVQGSNDGVNWVDLYSGTFHVNADPYGINESVEFDNNTAYEYYGLLFVAANSVTGRSYMTEFNLYSASVTTSEDAMSLIGLNNYCANTLLADATWCNAICNSTYFESVLNVKVPFMTSATTPEGEAFGSVAGTYYPWKAFNGTNSSVTDMWYAGIPSTIGYKFTRTVKVVRADITGRNTDAAHMYSVRNFVVQGSNDDFVSDVNDLGSFVNTDNSPRSFHNYIFANDTEYQSYRLSVSSGNRPSSGDPDTCAIGMLQFYGREDV